MRIFFLLFFVLFFASCDCVYECRGTVTDENGAALDSVSFYMEGRTKPEGLVTKSNGKFEVNEITGFGCGCKAVVFERNGYKTMTVDVNNGDTAVVIRMQKQ